jgi:ubiquinone/menaquinone biosynthesis C-methylase UbiE
VNHPSSRPSGHGITIGTPWFYDLSAALLFGGTRRRSYRRLLVASGVQPGDRALDLGCGPGYFTRMLAEAVSPEGSVVGIDAAPEMIEYAGRKARRLANCRFQLGAAESLAFPDASFDAQRGFRRSPERPLVGGCADQDRRHQGKGAELLSRNTGSLYTSVSH